MSSWKTISTLTLLSVFSIPYTQTLTAGTPVTWINPTNSTWNTTGNWSPARVPTSTDSANFLGISGSPTISINENVGSITTINQLQFGTGTTVYTLFPNTANDAISIVSTVNQPGIFLGNVTVNLSDLNSVGPVLFIQGVASDEFLINLSDASGSLNLTQGIVMTGVASTPIEIRGPGKMNITNAQINLSNSNNVTIDNGATVNLSNSSVSPNTQATIFAANLDVSAGSTLSVTNTSTTSMALLRPSVFTIEGTVNLTNTTSGNEEGINVLFNAGPGISPLLTFNNGAIFTATNNQAITTASTFGIVVGFSNGVTVNFNGGTTLFENNSSISASNCAGIISGGATSLAGGTHTLQNNGVIQNNAVAGILVYFHNFSVSGGTLNLTNTNSILSSASIGAEIDLLGSPMTMTDGTINLLNSGTIQNGIGAALTQAGNISFSGGSLTLQNTGTIQNSGAVGASFGGSGNLSFSGGSVSLLNSTPNVQSGSGVYFGSNSTGSTTLSNSFTATNSGNLSTTNTMGVQVGGGTLTFAGGTSLFENTGTINGSLGIAITPTNMIVNNGAVSLSNTANILAGSGVAFNGGSTFTINGGTTELQNSGIVQGGSGVLFTSPNGTVQNGSFIAINNANLSTAGAVGVQIGGSTLTFGGGTSTFENTGTINGSLGIAITPTNMIVNNGAVSLSNIANILAGSGVAFNGGATFTINGGTTQLQNSGIVQGGSGILFTSPNGTVQNGSFIAINNANLSTVGAVGVQIGGSTLIFGGGSSLFQNAAVMNGSVGLLITPSTLAITNGSVNFINSANIQAGTGVSGMSALTMNGGSFTLVNSGTIQNSSAIGSSYLDSGSILIQGGTINLVNTGTVDSGTGVFFGTNSSGSITMTGGTLALLNTGVVVGSAIGTVAASKSIQQSGGVIINDALVHTDTLFLTGGNYAGIGTTSNFTPGQTLTVTNAGTVTPGGPNPSGRIGVMTIQGNYTQTSGTLLINLQNNATSELMVTGIASLNGTLEVAETAAGDIMPGDHFTVLQASGGVVGQFSEVLDFHSPYLIPHAEYFSNSVQVFFTPTLFPDINPNDFSETGGLKNPKGGYVNLSRPVLSSVNETFARLTKQMGKLRSHFEKPISKSPKEKIVFSEKKTKDNKEPSIHLTSLSQDEPLSTFLDDESFITYDDVVTEEKRKRLTESLGSNERPWNFYVGPKGQLGNVVSKDEMQGYSHWSAGVFTGFDYAFSEVGVGILTEYERMQAHVGKKWGKFTIDHVHADSYATYAPSQLPEISVNGIFGGGYEWYSIDRNLNLPSPLAFKGTPRGAELDAFLGTEYAFRSSVFSAMPRGLQIIPEAAIEYTYLHIDDYKEKGFALFALRATQQNVKSLRSNLGFRICYDWIGKDVEISTEANFSWQREYLDKERSFEAIPVSFPTYSFPVIISEMGRNTALTGVDLLVTLFGRHGIETGYDFEYNSQYHTHFLYMSYNVRF
ncbi:MAG: autotransporter domain-containing protein [Chlamydiae bacterium]|nr:autotransporter domain-containing protein [Chlamydiota bacterium]